TVGISSPARSASSAALSTASGRAASTVRTTVAESVSLVTRSTGPPNRTEIVRFQKPLGKGVGSRVEIPVNWRKATSGGLFTPLQATMQDFDPRRSTEIEA